MRLVKKFWNIGHFGPFWACFWPFINPVSVSKGLNRYIWPSSVCIEWERQNRSPKGNMCPVCYCFVQKEVLKQDQSYPWIAIETSWWLFTTNFWDPEANMGAHHWVKIHAPFQRMPGAKRTVSSISITDLDEYYISHNSGSRPKYVWMGGGWLRVWTESRFWWEHQKTAGYLWCHHEEMWLQKQSLSL